MKHVGLLGATAPAVNGLGTVKFAGEEEGMAFTLDFASDDYAWEVRSWRKAVARLMRGIREYMVAEKGVEAADHAMKDWDVDAAVNPPTPPETQENTASYSEASPTTPAQQEEESVKKETGKNAKATADFAAREEAIAAREQAFTKREEEQAHAHATSFCEGLVAQGRIPAESKDLVCWRLCPTTPQWLLQQAMARKHAHPAKRCVRL